MRRARQEVSLLVPHRPVERKRVEEKQLKP